jgi:glutamate/tyrosine decarboxylase-like PLP-dependent enzyme
MASVLPKTGLGRQAIAQLLDELRSTDVDQRHADWSDHVFMYVFHVNAEVSKVAEDAYVKFAKTDALGPTDFPSVTKVESDLVAIALDLLHGSDKATGSVTTGGTESIFLGMKTARDWAAANRPVSGVPEMIAPDTVHPAFSKAAHYLGMKVTRLPEGPDGRADVEAMAGAITDNTIGLIGSAPQFWYGAFDPIAELGELAQTHNLWLHVDGCMGGFLAPFARKAGYPIPDFDFAVPGVKSISADMHKYGFALKGASVIVLSDVENRQYQVFDWQDQHERYLTPTFSGTRSGAAIAAAWAVMQYLGEDGYVELAGSIMRSKQKLVDCIESSEDLVLLGEPELSIVAFGSDTVDVFSLAKALESRGWLPNAFTGPNMIHVRFTPAHEPVMDRFVADMEASVDEVRRGEVVAEGRSRTYTG